MLAFAFVILQFAAHANAQCAVELFKSSYNKIDTTHSDYRMAQYLTQAQYDEATQNMGLNVVIYGVPVGASYADYHKSAEQMASYYSASLTEDEALNLSWMGLDQNARDAYHDCLQAQIFNQDGLHAAVVDATNTTVAITVRWFRPGNHGKPAMATWIPASIEPQVTKQFPKGLPEGESTVIINRPSTGEIIVAGNFSGDTTGPISVTAVIVAPPGPACPNLTGNYSSNSGLTMLVAQNVCSISSKFAGPSGEAHTLLGSYSIADKVFYYDVYKSFQGCNSVLHGQLNQISAQGFQSYVTSTSNTCGAQAVVGEKLGWTKLGH